MQFLLSRFYLGYEMVSLISDLANKLFLLGFWKNSKSHMHHALIGLKDRRNSEHVPSEMYFNLEVFDLIFAILVIQQVLVRENQIKTF